MAHFYRAGEAIEIKKSYRQIKKARRRRLI